MSRKLVNKHKRTVNIIAHTDPKSPIAEQYRQIRNNIHFSSVDTEIKSIVITSPEPSDGKSTTAANLAIVLAQEGKAVLLVDADLRKPTVHYAFNESNIVGLTSVLTREIRLEQAILRTDIPNLFILTSGTIPPNPSELLNSKAMELVMKELKENFKFIVYDTPPILAVTDSQILANKCDGVVMVISSGKTQKDVALKAKEVLDNAKAGLLGVVVNGVETGNGGYYYDYA